MNAPLPDLPPEVDLNDQELRLLQALRLLQEIEPHCLEKTEQFVWSLVAESLKWNYGDPDTLARAMKFAALDPFLRKEVERVESEFANAESDGLEDY
jgi:hypothetical protein